ncbi:hypothetical protein ABT266_16875, partial [Amycolatopsis sp. NPDC000746]
GLGANGNGVGGPGTDPGVKGLGESDLPKLPDPVSNHEQQLPAPGTPPMIPPAGMGGGNGLNTPAAERPDSSGLLGNVQKPWTADLPGGVGDPSASGETPPSESTGWAPPAPGMPGSTANGTPAERPDSAGLLGDVQQPWAASTPAGIGNPAPHGETPPSASAGWATGAGIPIVPSNSNGTSTPERPDSAELLTSVQEPRAPSSTVDAPANTGWATTSKDNDLVRIAVVQPLDHEDTSAWDVGTAEFLPALLPVSTAAEDRPEEITTDFVQRSDEPWRPNQADEEPALGTYQRVRGGPAEVVPDELPTCGDAPEPLEPEADTAEEETEEEEERTMADLLRQDDAAWGKPARRSSPGVLE